MRESRGGTGVRTPLKKIRFLSKTGPNLLSNHKATKPAFNVGPSSACQQNAISMMACLKWYLDPPSPQQKKNKKKKKKKPLTKLSGSGHVNAAEKQTLLHRFMSMSMVHEMKVKVCGMPRTITMQVHVHG